MAKGESSGNHALRINCSSLRVQTGWSTRHARCWNGAFQNKIDMLFLRLGGGNKTTQSLQGSNAARDEGHAHGRGTSPAHNSEKQTIAAFVVANRCFSGCDPYLGC